MDQINSTKLLEVLEDIARVRGYNTEINIEELAATELEHRDEITINISNCGQPGTYNGSVRLMKESPDEQI